MKTIVTHTNPDFDAIASVWLLKKYMLPEAQIVFVNTASPDPDALESAAAVVDTGKVLNPGELRFDHHQLPGAAANETSAAMQVYEHLLVCGEDIAHLRPLVDLIYQGDTGKPEANHSRAVGLHALLSGFKSLFSERNPGERLPDMIIYAEGAGLLDMLESWLRKQAEARSELAEKVVYKSEDGRVWAIRHGGVSTTFAAQEEGAQIIVFEAEPREVEGGTTYGIGVTRAQESTVNVGDLAKYAAAKRPELAEEVGRWFCHPAGFFAGRGTAKAPVFEPVEIDIAELAAAISDALNQ